MTKITLTNELGIEDLQAEFGEKRDEITTLTAKAEALRSENAVPSIPSMEAFKGLATMWSRADAGMVNEALRSVVKRIYVHRADVQRDDFAGRLDVIGLWERPLSGDLRSLCLPSLVGTGPLQKFRPSVSSCSSPIGNDRRTSASDRSGYMTADAAAS
jgi:hypothetical protein